MVLLWDWFKVENIDSDCLGFAACVTLTADFVLVTSPSASYSSQSSTCTSCFEPLTIFESVEGVSGLRGVLSVDHNDPHILVSQKDDLDFSIFDNLTYPKSQTCVLPGCA